MTQRMVLSLCAMACLFFGALAAEANMQSNRWFSEVTQDGRDVRFKLQLIEEDPPNFDTTFMLVRDDKLFFEHKQFVREEADEVFGPGCVEVNTAELGDCDSDGTDECAGICGTAYRYDYVDKCVPLDVGLMYQLFDESTFIDGGIPSEGPESEGYFYIFDLQPTDAECDDAGVDTDSDSDVDTDTDTDTDSDTDADPGSTHSSSSSGCSMSPVTGRSSEAFAAALMLLVGLGCVVIARRRKNR